MQNLREYGRPPYYVAVVHGGPGAAGSMAPVARELATIRGVLEPLQAALSIGGQVSELHGVLERHGQPPVTLVGHSWGAWLGLILAARHPSLVKKLILVGCGPLEEKYSPGIMEKRLSRLDEGERREARALMEAMGGPAVEGKNALFARFGRLMSKADTFAPLLAPDSDEGVTYREDVYRCVWGEAAELRRSGELLRLAGRVRCPVVAVHGDFDPHPAEGVERPLRQAIRDFRLILLGDCGHEPWRERGAREKFYRVLEEEITCSSSL